MRTSEIRSITNSKTNVDVHRLKNFAFEKLPKDWALRECLLAERDLLNVDEFLAKMDVWFKLLRVGRKKCAE